MDNIWNDLWDKCAKCSHYLGEHNPDGPCFCIVIEMSQEYVCPCESFVESEE